MEKRCIGLLIQLFSYFSHAKATAKYNIIEENIGRNNKIGFAVREFFTTKLRECDFAVVNLWLKPALYPQKLLIHNP